MKISEIQKKRIVLSFEVFPPKQPSGVEPLYRTLDKLYEYNPDMISCTHGAGGTNEGCQAEILKYITANHKKAMANLTCIGKNCDMVDDYVDHYKEFGVNTFLALRGDYPKGKNSTGGSFEHADGLIAYMYLYHPEIEIGAACYPEGHIESKYDVIEEYITMSRKYEFGADFFVSQLCYDTKRVFRFLDGGALSFPILIGVMPVLEAKSAIRMAVVNGCSIPRKLAKIVGKYSDNPDDFKKAGKEYTAEQIEDLVRNGIKGLQIFTMNKYQDVADILDMAGLSDRKNKERSENK